MKPYFLLLLSCSNIALATSVVGAGPPSADLGHAHIETTCSPTVSKTFDVGVALLHNFWYPRALLQFEQIITADPQCAMAYWGAAMTYNHPYWDPPTDSDERKAWALVKWGMKAKEMSPREKMYLDAVAALYRNGGEGTRAERATAYMNNMAAIYAKYPDDETKLFYALSILDTLEEGSAWSAQQELAANLIEQVYADDPHNPGALHYMIHAYDDPVHASQGLKAARGYAEAAPAVPHALHMPSHIFTRLGYWDESAATNDSAWRVSEADAKEARETGAYRDFHSLNYLQYSYIQLGRYQDAKRITAIFAAQYQDLPSKDAQPDSPDLEVRHLRGRTIYALPGRVVYGYFDTLARYIIESGNWQLASALPSVPVSRDFAAMRLQVETLAAANRGDPAAALAAADKICDLSNEPGQRPLARKVLSIQAKEAQATAAQAAGQQNRAMALMDEAVGLEDSIYALSQPPYPPIPAHELYGAMLLEMNHPSEAKEQFEQTLKRTPGRPKAIYGLARSAQALGDNQTAARQYEIFLGMWKNADQNLPQLAVARQFLGSTRFKSQ